MSALRMLVAITSVALCFGLGACKKKGGGDKAKKGDTMEASGMDMGAGMGMAGSSGAKLSHKDNPKAGDSCKGLSPTEGRLACEGNARIFCSSVSQYKWKKLGDCKSPTKCVVGPGGKSVSCK